MNDQIPYSISEYVNRHFRDDFLLSCRKISGKDGKVFYDVEVSKDDITHQLMFDSKGMLIKEDLRQEYSSNIREDVVRDDYPSEEFRG